MVAGSLKAGKLLKSGSGAWESEACFTVNL